MSMRINRFIADTGYCSRRQADQLIESGKVLLNGKPAELGALVTERDKVVVEGKTITRRQEDYTYILLYKPRGITCTTDRRRRDNIIDYLGYHKRLFHVGRLDRDSEGLILLTDDGSIVNSILREAENKEKEYEVTIDRDITPQFLKQMENGIPILNTITKHCKTRQLTSRSFRIILTQGLNRQIRRMCEYCGYQVINLKRVRIMHISCGSMEPGDWRYLTDKEIEALTSARQCQLKNKSSQTEALNKRRTQPRRHRRDRK